MNSLHFPNIASCFLISEHTCFETTKFFFRSALTTCENIIFGILQCSRLFFCHHQVKIIARNPPPPEIADPYPLFYITSSSLAKVNCKEAEWIVDPCLAKI